MKQKTSFLIILQKQVYSQKIIVAVLLSSLIASFNVINSEDK